MVKNLSANAEDTGSISGSGRSFVPFFHKEGNGNPLRYSCLRNPTDRGAWQATVHGVTRESDTTSHRNNKPLCENSLFLSHANQTDQSKWGKNAEVLAPLESGPKTRVQVLAAYLGTDPSACPQQEALRDHE